MKEQKEIWLTDVPLTEKSRRRLNAGINTNMTISSITALGSLATFITALTKLARKKITKRKFIKLLALGAGLVSPITRQILTKELRTHDSKIKFHTLWNLDNKIDELIGGKGVTKIRNAITAEKTESFVASHLRQKLNRKPVIAMVWGFTHYGVKRLLENPIERKRILKENNLEKYVKKDYPKSFRIHFDANGKVSKIEVKETLKVNKKKPTQRKTGPISRREMEKTIFKPFRNAARAMKRV